MTDYQLFVANKNYSSWSLRPWVLMQQLGIPFDEQVLEFGNDAQWAPFRKLSPSGKVPCLRDRAADVVVWDSLAIAEYLAERYPAVWPSDARARAWARSAAAEMHSGFGTLRDVCSMNVGVRVRLHEVSPALERDIARFSELWLDGLSRFGGPFLGGAHFTAVDAFFCPVAFRVQTYGLALEPAATAYAQRLLGLAPMKSWAAAGLAETWRDAGHEADLPRSGVVIQDQRAT